MDEQLLKLGLTRLERPKRMSDALNAALYSGERVIAAVSGIDQVGNRILLAATFGRLIWVKRIPLFNSVDELPYMAVKGVRFRVGTLWRTVVELDFGDNTLVLHAVRKAVAEAFVHSVQRMTTLARVEMHYAGLAV